MSDTVFVFSLSPSYGVTTDGRVFRLENAHQLRPCVLKRGGYLAVSLWEGGVAKTWPVHQVVCHVFHGQRPTPKHHAAHRDGNKSNNSEGNIRWATKIENERDKVAHGTSNRGERCGTAILRDGDIIEIRKLVAALPRSSGGKRIKKGAMATVAKQFGVTNGCISQIISGKHWGHVK